MTEEDFNFLKRDLLTIGLYLFDRRGLDAKLIIYYNDLKTYGMNQVSVDEFFSKVSSRSQEIIIWNMDFFQNCY